MDTIKFNTGQYYTDKPSNERNEMTTFANRVRQAVQDAQALDTLTLSPAQIEDALMPVVRDLWNMPLEEAKAYIKASFSHVGYEARALRLFKHP